MLPASIGRLNRLSLLPNATLRKYLNSMSDLLNRAVSDGVTKTNAARDLHSASKPKPERVDARYWESDEVVALLESARTLVVPKPGNGRGGGILLRADAYPWVYPLIATAALTGTRKSELFGLEVDVVSFQYKRIFIRPIDWRTLKTRGSERDVHVARVTDRGEVVEPKKTKHDAKRKR